MICILALLSINKAIIRSQINAVRYNQAACFLGNIAFRPSGGYFYQAGHTRGLNTTGVHRHGINVIIRNHGANIA